AGADDEFVESESYDGHVDAGDGAADWWEDTDNAVYASAATAAAAIAATVLQRPAATRSEWESLCATRGPI
ncbi:hypothetical protein LTS12_020707, partial [Elasticomyces elasticus]